MIEDKLSIGAHTIALFYLSKSEALHSVKTLDYTKCGIKDVIMITPVDEKFYNRNNVIVSNFKALPRILGRNMKADGVEPMVKLITVGDKDYHVALFVASSIYTASDVNAEVLLEQIRQFVVRAQVSH